MAPRITVAIPLHRSAPWVDNVVDNVRVLPAAVTEIIVSDRTCADDAAHLLRDRLADDPRVIVRTAASGLGWEEHYQELVELASGDLFMWMPHDDLFDPSWVPVLTEALANHPQAWLAFGRLEAVLKDGGTPFRWQPRSHPPGVIVGWSALRMMLDGDMGVPFRGLFRRQEVLEAGLRLRPASTFQAVDMLWVFAVALRSALVYDDRTVVRKRYYPESTHAPWRRRAGDLESVSLAALREHGPTGVKGAQMRWYTLRAYVKARARPPARRIWRRVEAATSKS